MHAKYLSIAINIFSFTSIDNVFHFSVTEGITELYAPLPKFISLLIFKKQGWVERYIIDNYNHNVIRDFVATSNDWADTLECLGSFIWASSLQPLPTHPLRRCREKWLALIVAPQASCLSVWVSSHRSRQPPSDVTTIHWLERAVRWEFCQYCISCIDGTLRFYRCNLGKVIACCWRVTPTASSVQTGAFRTRTPVVNMLTAVAFEGITCL